MLIKLKKKINIKNCTYCYWNFLININDPDFINILVSKVPYEYLSIYCTKCKKLYNIKDLYIVFRKIFWHISKCLTLIPSNEMEKDASKIYPENMEEN